MRRDSASDAVLLNVASDDLSSPQACDAFQSALSVAWRQGRAAVDPWKAAREAVWSDTGATTLSGPIVAAVDKLSRVTTLDWLSRENQPGATGASGYGVFRSNLSLETLSEPAVADYVTGVMDLSPSILSARLNGPTWAADASALIGKSSVRAQSQAGSIPVIQVQSMRTQLDAVCWGASSAKWWIRFEYHRRGLTTRVPTSLDAIDKPLFRQQPMVPPPTSGLTCEGIPEFVHASQAILVDRLEWGSL